MGKLSRKKLEKLKMLKMKKKNCVVLAPIMRFLSTDLKFPNPRCKKLFTFKLIFKKSLGLRI